MKWYDWTFPDFADLPLKERQQIERISAFLAVWDWRTLLALPIMGVGIWLVELLFPGEEKSDLGGWTAVLVVALGLIYFLGTFFVLMRRHARSVAARWKARQAAVAAGLPPVESRASTREGEESLAGWQKFIYNLGLLGGPSAVLVGVFKHWWELAGLGAIVFLVGVAVATTSRVCAACLHVQIQFGVRLAHCPKCGTSFHARE
jgi:hypothetical protein